MSRRGVCPSCGNDLGSGGDDCLTCSAFADGVRYATKLDADRAAELIATARDKALEEAIAACKEIESDGSYFAAQRIEALRAAGEKKT